MSLTMSNFIAPVYEELSRQPASTAQIQREAQHLYQRFIKGKSGLGWLWRKKSKLLELKEIETKAELYKPIYKGVKEVPLDLIKGSEGRENDFDGDFRPIKPTDETILRWKSIAQAELKGESLPAVALLQVDNVFYVRDGHHRISVAKALGRATIDAAVTVWL
jgi:hypothetical protein